MSSQNDAKLNSVERRASISLALIFALRMLGLFLLLPVFAIEAQKYPGANNPALVGLAFGIYGLTQALLQIPYGWASDRFGRKRVIALGLLVFLFGTLWAAFATDIWGLLLGRALQGAGAVSAAVSALLADLTRDAVRTKAMAIVGASIGLSFAVSLVVATPLTAALGLSGLFDLMAVLVALGLLALFFLVPPEPERQGERKPMPFRAVLQDSSLMRLNAGVFILHAVQTAMWLVVPALLLQAGLPQAAHWQVYLPSVVLAFGLMGAFLFKIERAGHLRIAFLGAISCILLVQIGLYASLGAANLWVLGGLLFVFFIAFNTLEATQPSLVSRHAAPAQRGAALGVYGTTQSLGLFAGGAIGGWILKNYAASAVCMVSALLMLVWFGLAWGMPATGYSVKSAA